MDPRTVRNFGGKTHSHGKNTCLRCGKWIRNFHEHVPFCKALIMSAIFFWTYQSSKMCFKTQTANSQVLEINVKPKKKTKIPSRIARDAKRLAEYNSKKAAALSLPFFNLASEEFDSEIKSHQVLLVQFDREKENLEQEIRGNSNTIHQQNIKIKYFSSTLEKAYREIQAYKQWYESSLKISQEKQDSFDSMTRIVLDMQREYGEKLNAAQFRPPPQNSNKKKTLP